MPKHTRVLALLLLGLLSLVLMSACGSNEPEEQQANMASSSPVITTEPTPKAADKAETEQNSNTDAPKETETPAETQEATIEPAKDIAASPKAKPTDNVHEGGHSSGKEDDANNKGATPQQTATPKPKPTATQPAKETPTDKPAGQVHIVEIVNFAFSPAELTVKAGDSVKFINKDEVGHTATADDKTFDTGKLDLDQANEIIFANEGEFSYYCLPHPAMKGTIIVEAD
ncbi:cupredoxin domain-containing protein [Paenibacillus sp. YIM B09110]|uniref:cupredoxin domain-containing protein n=1 Tax=Paenibacillus sp. YIM B09110 TaxID=3126102 RepID=UPI00301C9EE9